MAISATQKAALVAAATQTRDSAQSTLGAIAAVNEAPLLAVATTARDATQATLAACEAIVIAAPEPPASTGEPAWLAGKAVNEWVAIAGSELSTSDISVQAAAGLCNPNGTAIDSQKYGNPRKGIMDFSGGALRQEGSEMLIFGGGGAGAWAGNDIRGLPLEQDAPRWRTVVNPSPASAVWPRGSPNNAYMQDGKPNARHSYSGPQTVGERFYAFGCRNTWENDQGMHRVVDSCDLASKQWSPAGSHPNLPDAISTEARWSCQHPTTLHVYVCANTRVDRFDPASNSWALFYNNNADASLGNGFACIDPVKGKLLRIGSWFAAWDTVPVTIDLTTKQRTVATFTGPHGGPAFKVGVYSGITFDEYLERIVLFKDDGHLYTLTHVADNEWSVDRLPMTGTAPVALASAVHGGPSGAVWGRFRFVKKLRGVALIQAYSKPAYFVRTSTAPPNPNPPDDPVEVGRLTVQTTKVPFTAGPERVFGSAKHLMFAYLDGRHYKLFGDHAGLASNVPTQGTGMQGGREEVVSFTVGRNDWRLDSPYYLPAPGVQQAFPDDGFLIVRNDEAFIFAGATNAATNPPYTPPGKATQLWGRVTAYKPGRGYRDVCKMPAECMSNRAWGGGYDPVLDVFVIPCEVSGNVLVVLRGDGASYHTVKMPGTFQFAGVAVDSINRRGYVYDHAKAQLWAINLDTYTTMKVCDVPEPPMGGSPIVDVLWHPTLQAVVLAATKLHVFTPSNGSLVETFPREDGINAGRYVAPSTIFHDPETDDLVSIGTIDFVNGARSDGYWRIRLSREQA